MPFQCVSGENLLNRINFITLHTVMICHNIVQEIYLEGTTRWGETIGEKVVSLEDRIPKLQQQRKQKTNRRLISFLSIFFLLILLVIYFQSPLSKVSSITVKGNVHVESEKIIEMSKITTSNGFWNINTTKTSQLIEDHLQIKQATVEKSFLTILSCRLMSMTVLLIWKRMVYLSRF